jgi:catechol 2,3-dioxygenase-like lactoylglutathione lyase family enzyme
MSINVRYIVDDVDTAVKFYTEQLKFTVEMQPAPGFAALKRDNLRLLLNAPGAGGAGTTLADGTAPQPGGWNRFQIEVENLAATVEKLKGQNATFRNEIVDGNGGKQILLEDPSGNPIELFESKR